MIEDEGAYIINRQGSHRWAWLVVGVFIGFVSSTIASHGSRSTMDSLFETIDIQQAALETYTATIAKLELSLGEVDSELFEISERDKFLRAARLCEEWAEDECADKGGVASVGGNTKSGGCWWQCLETDR